MATKHVFWTGGWSSSFRVLSLLADGHYVQPHYIINPDLKSLRHELKAINDIRRLFVELSRAKRYRFFRENLLAVKYRGLAEISKNEHISSCFNHLQQFYDLGQIYRHLANYHLSWAHENIDVCVDASDKSVQNIIDFLKNRDGATGIENSSSSSSFQEIFKFFNFPLIQEQVTKQQMKEQFKESPLEKVFDLTWSCTNPKEEATPCGFCQKCLQSRTAKSHPMKYFQRWFSNKRLPSRHAVDSTGI